MKGRHILAGALLLPALPAALWAQDAQDSTCLFAKGEACLTAAEIAGKLDFGPPALPLNTLMNATPETTFSPKASAEWAFSVAPQILGALEGEASSIGLSFNPGLFLLGDTSTPEEIYFNDRPTWKARLTEFSLMGTYIKDAGENGYTQTGVGLSYTFDKNSPLRSHVRITDCFQDSLPPVPIQQDVLQTSVPELSIALSRAGLSGAKQSAALKTVLISADAQNKIDEAKLARDLQAIGTTSAKASAAAAEIAAILRRATIDGESIPALHQRVAKACLEKLLPWNREMYSLGLAGYNTHFDSGDSKQGYGVWASAAFPLGRNGQGLVSGRWTENLLRASLAPGAADGSTESVDGWGVGMRYTHLLAGKASRSPFTRGFFEVGYTEEEFSDIDDKYWQAGVGAEIKLTDELFMQFVVGKTFDSEIDRSEYLSAQLNWSFSSLAAR